MKSAQEPVLSAIFHPLVKKAPSGLSAETIASLLGRDYKTMMSELSRQPGHKLGADLVPRLLDLVDSDIPLQELARWRDGVFIKLPSVTGGDIGPLTEQMVETVSKFALYLKTLSDSLLDGKIVEEERARITMDGHETIVAIVAIQQVVEKLVTK